MSHLYFFALCIFLLAAGASPLGDMPNAAELASLASLGLPLAPGGEDPLTAVPGSASSASGRDSCKLTSSGATHPTPATGRSGVCSASASPPAGFSLGHSFPLIPQKLFSKIMKWEYVSMAELLPDNLEVARRSEEAQSSASCSSKAPKKKRSDRGLERFGGMVRLLFYFRGHNCQGAP